ncbi:MAG: DUF2335 domain-containing protein [Ghiorsea sp.]|nr:DUF2335 domain-containing protein [Ghiorsea sp.]
MSNRTPTKNKKRRATHSKHVLRQEIREETFHSGPIPAPEMLAAYSKIIPNAPERILAMAEIESQHRQDLEKKTLSANINDRKSARFEIKLAQILAATICLSLIAAGTYLALSNQSATWPGVFLSSTGLAGIIVAYLKK